MKALALAVILTMQLAYNAHAQGRVVNVIPPWPVPHGAQYETRWVSHTKLIHWYTKLNPVWWFLNDDQQRVDQAPWYHPEWPEWFRIFMWNCCRNPMQNFRTYVIGVQDRSFYVTMRKPWGTIQRNDLCSRDAKGKILSCQTGYERGWLWGGDLSFPLPFISYSGKNVVWYVGYQPGGFAGVKFNLHSCKGGYSATC